MFLNESWLNKVVLCSHIQLQGLLVLQLLYSFPLDSSKLLCLFLFLSFLFPISKINFVMMSLQMEAQTVSRVFCLSSPTFISQRCRSAPR